MDFFFKLIYYFGKQMDKIHCNFVNFFLIGFRVHKTQFLFFLFFKLISDWSVIMISFRGGF
jgi:hypothetical protein